MTRFASFTLAALGLLALVPTALARPAKAPAAQPGKLRKATLRRVRALNPTATVSFQRRDPAELQRAEPPADLERVPSPAPATPRSRVSLAADLEVDPSALSGPYVLGFGRPAFTTTSGIDVFVQALGTDAVARHDDGLTASWWFGKVPTRWPSYHEPFGVAVHLEDVPAGKQLVLECELTVYNGKMVQLVEIPGSADEGEAVTMTLQTVESDAAWGASTAHLFYVTTARARRADAHIYIAADQFAFRDENCSLTELTP